MLTKRILSIRFLRMLFVALVVARGLFSVAAASELVPLRIALSAPATCPAMPTMFERVRRHTSLVREASAGERARLMTVTVASRAEGFVAELRLADERDVLERRVPGTSCDEVLEAVALIAALAIDARAADLSSSAPTSELRDAASDASRLLSPPPRWTTDAAAPRARDAASARPPTSNIAVSFGTSLEIWSLRSGATNTRGAAPVLGTALWFEGALPSRLAPSLRVRLSRSRSFTEGEPGRPAGFRLSTAALEGCVRLDDSRALQVRPCVQVTGGVIQGASSAYGSTERRPRPWASLGALLQGRWYVLRPLALEAALGFALPLVRDDFFFRPSAPIYRAPPVLLLGDVGFGVTFD